MVCPNCGSNVNMGEIYCGVCGNKVTDRQFSTQYTQNSNELKENEDLVRAYIGKNADKIMNGGFSINTLLFGIFYLIYRKMWLLATLWIVAVFITSVFLPTFSPIIGDVLLIVLAFQMKKWYLQSVEEKVNKIVLQNQGMPKEELLSLCAKKGGTSVLSLILFIIAFIILIGVLAIKVLDDKKDKDLSNNVTNKTYDLKVNIPNEFKLVYSSDNINYKGYDYFTTTDSCTVTLSTTESSYYNNSAEKYLQNSVRYSIGDKVSSIEQTKINNNTWYVVNVQDEMTNTYNYASAYNGNVYHVEFSIYDDKTQKCSSLQTQTINSLRFK